MENWGNIPHERTRLSDLLNKHKSNHTFAISGHVHFAAPSKLDLESNPIYDLTSSRMSNISKGWGVATNSLRVGESHPVQNVGLIEIDWADKSIELAIIDKDGEKILKQPLKFFELNLYKKSPQPRRLRGL